MRGGEEGLDHLRAKPDADTVRLGVGPGSEQVIPRCTVVRDLSGSGRLYPPHDQDCGRRDQRGACRSVNREAGLTWDQMTGKMVLQGTRTPAYPLEALDKVRNILHGQSATGIVSATGHGWGKAATHRVRKVRARGPKRRWNAIGNGGSPRVF
jgi:hypothetical protein